MRMFQSILRGMLLVFFITFSMLVLSQGSGSAQLTAEANHNRLAVNFFYHGGTVSIQGVSDPGTDLIVKVTSVQAQHEELLKKGKVGGLLWMNVGELNFEHVPAVYMIRSTRDPEEILSPEERVENIIGYPALRESIAISPAATKEEKSQWFDEFVKFNERSRLYSVAKKGVTTMEHNGEQHYSLAIQWPYQALPGDYVVTVYAVKDHHIIEQAESKVLVEQVGAVKTFASMAKNHGAWYGIVSIFVAMTSGFGVGIIFKKGGGAH